MGTQSKRALSHVHLLSLHGPAGRYLGWNVGRRAESSGAIVPAAGHLDPATLAGNGNGNGNGADAVLRRVRGDAMKVVRSRDFTAERAWGALEVARVEAITARLHWTDKAYPWHANDGDELFVVLDGVVDMHVRRDGVESVITLHAGDMFFGEQGMEHSARPRGEARLLVVEREDSP